MDLEDSLEINKTGPPFDIYYCTFLAKQSIDMKKSDEFSRFWSEWHKYTRWPRTHNIIYGDHIMIRSNHTPDSSKYRQWSDSFPLLHNSHHSHSIIEPFDLEKVDECNRTWKKVSTFN